MTTDWITAVSTAATALAAIFAAVIGLRQYRREGQAPTPVIEPYFDWVSPSKGHFVRLTLVVRNQLYETITLESLRVRRPHGMTFARELQETIQTDVNAKPMRATLTVQIRYETTGETERVLDWLLSPVGETYIAFRGSRHEHAEKRDVGTREFYLSPPQKWDGGTLLLELRLSSNALTIPRRTITIKRQLAPAPASNDGPS